jgi:Ca2+-transporting ATPase
MIPYYQRSIQDSLAQVDSSLQGLSEQQAHHRLQLYGKNIIKEEQEQTVFQIFLHQLQSPLVIILIVAGIISGAIGEYIDAVIIILIVIVNAVFGCIQEYKADKAIQSLKKMSGLKSKVIRDGTIHSIDASSLTIGDIMILDTGDHISADARLIESINLESQESLLTGESVPVPKHIHPIQHAGSVGDMYNMVFRGTTVST